MHNNWMIGKPIRLQCNHNAMQSNSENGGLRLYDFSVDLPTVDGTVNSGYYSIFKQLINHLPDLRTILPVSVAYYSCTLFTSRSILYCHPATSKRPATNDDVESLHHPPFSFSHQYIEQIATLAGLNGRILPYLTHPTSTTLHPTKTMNPLKLTVILAWIACQISAFAIVAPQYYCSRYCAAAQHHQSKTFLQAEQFPWEAALDMADEETLLQLHLTLANQNVDPDLALAKVQQYTQSFPFSAILPVQPLSYLPTHEGGVDVLFLRKKTDEKGSVDGGMRFFVTSSQENGGVEVQVKRNSKGQSVGKVFTEKLVVQAYCDGISGNDETRTGSAPLEFVSVSSVFHKWM